ncbi:hypothetical protein ACOI1H_24095 [Loktanella sp. DJP18]|uniref:hypothetical protein n=1 Tax=Loktanella sp. DJP18 TaxID=3409788 RepID=UPI003BB77FCB
MTMKFTKLTGATAIVAALMAGPALAQDMWDANSDGALGAEEFATGFADRGIFSSWDQDSDGLLSDTEFSDGVYGTYDADVSGDLDETEYGMIDEGRSASGYWGNDEVGYDYQAWDVDGDGVILSNEFADGWGETGMFGEFDVDTDGALSEDEFSNGVFGQYDEDGTGIIEEPELTDIGDDMGDEGFWDV